VGKRSKFKPKGRPDDYKSQQAWSHPKKNATKKDDKDEPEVVLAREGDWEPREIVMYSKGQKTDELDDSKPHVVWAHAPAAVKPDSDGDVKPVDLLFYVGPTRGGFYRRCN
jgi:hypothetical protein